MTNQSTPKDVAEREAFEKSFAQYHLDRVNGGYSFRYVQHAWEGWQAACAWQRSTQLPALNEIYISPGIPLSHELWRLRAYDEAARVPSWELPAIASEVEKRVAIEIAEMCDVNPEIDSQWQPYIPAAKRLIALSLAHTAPARNVELQKARDEIAELRACLDMVVDEDDENTKCMRCGHEWLYVRATKKRIEKSQPTAAPVSDKDMRGKLYGLLEHVLLSLNDQSMPVSYMNAFEKAGREYIAAIAGKEKK